MADNVFQVAPDGTIVLDQPVELPPVLDMLVVGGGPFGTAAAFRAKELGLSALVVDYDDLMKRIRDYAKDKLILPDFGGGDQMQFPDGGELTRALHFGPIDKDEMCRQWKGFYRKFNIPAQVGVEMTGIEKAGDAWRVKCYNHRLKKEQFISARHVVLAFGRGNPRRLDVPGGVEGVAFGLKDTSQYVGQPVCVIGGGTSAAEAVIAVSNAKLAANDNGAVFWSYRAAQMPKVSKALADVFFEAFIVNGNVRYLPNSEPVAMVEVDGDQFLAVRTSRSASADGPIQTTSLEFRTRSCIACIGEDIPRDLMQQIGVPLVSGGPSNKERVIVTPALETRQPNVYLAGDVLSPVYFETTDFDGNPEQFPEVKRRGNIKAALRDGVLVAEVIRQKLEGRATLDVTLSFVKDAGGTAVPPVPKLGPASVPPPVPAMAACRLVSVLPGGVDADEYALKDTGPTTIGRQGADILFANDNSLAEVHAEIVPLGNFRYALVDRGGSIGVFVQPAPGRGIALDPESVIHVGRQWLVVGEKDAPRRLVHYDASGKRKAQFDLKDGVNLIGRDSPDITIAPDDGSLSRRHLSVALTRERLVLKDVGSANGTQLKVKGRFNLADGDRILIGRQVLRFDDERTKTQPSPSVIMNLSNVEPARLRPDARPDAAPKTEPSIKIAIAPPKKEEAAPPKKAEPPPPPAPPKQEAPAGGPSVFFAGLNRQVPCNRNQTICEIAEKAGIPIRASCHVGQCAEDAVRVVSGADQLTPPGQTEKDTLEDVLSREAGPYRLACMARVIGPVSVELLKQK